MPDMASTYSGVTTVCITMVMTVITERNTLRMMRMVRCSFSASISRMMSAMFSLYSVSEMELSVDETDALRDGRRDDVSDAGDADGIEW